MLVLEYKAVVKRATSKAIDEAIRTSQFVRNKVLRYWMDNRGVKPSALKCGKKELYQYNTQLRAEFKFVNDLNSHASHASVENVERAINRFFDNCKKNKPGKKGYPRFKKHSRSVEYKVSGWKLHPTKRRITFTDKKGIGELKLLGKWDIHQYPVELIKRVRIVRRAVREACAKRMGAMFNSASRLIINKRHHQLHQKSVLMSDWNFSTLIAMAIMKIIRAFSAEQRKILSGFNVTFTRRKKGHLAEEKHVVFMLVSI